jgi:hypothetical protein
MNSIMKMWSQKSSDRKAPRRKRADLNLERLETKQLLSWSSVPATFGWPSSYDAGFVSNGRSGTNTIIGSEVDVYRFVAPRSGTYTFKAARNGSNIDTIAGLYNWAGNRLGSNDDSNGTTDSTFTAYLTGGVQYAYAVTNYTGRANGAYRWEIDGPPLSVSLNTTPSSGITSYGYASLTGNNLYVYIYGNNTTNFSTHTHRIDVYLLNSNNTPIHTGSWWVSTNTAGRFIPFTPSSNSNSRTWDLSNWDLRDLRNMRIVVS